jgi:phosphatidylethanolamine/phosphatidyl-N-methylethanolamine N-methyltransferase
MSDATTRALVLDELRFLRSLIARPRTIGAIAPSSAALARKMALQVDPSQSGHVLELGPGTGVVTEALIARGIAPERLIAIEADPDLAQLVVQRFPRARVLLADAFDFARSLESESVEQLAAVVSSLPLLNFASTQRGALIASALERLIPGAPFVQFSYGWNAPVPPPPGATLARAGIVFANLPPAQVWVYRRA